MVSNRLIVVGCGEIGTATLKAFLAHRSCVGWAIAGVDISPERREAVSKELGVVTLEHMPEPEERFYDYIIISTWSTDQVTLILDIIQSKTWPNLILVSVESTIDPARWLEFAKYTTLPVVFSPHRFNPNDPDHNVFNQPRLVGPINDRTLLSFYHAFYDEIVLVKWHVAIWAKVVENAYRYMEIVLAQELREMCHGAGAEFEEIRQAANSKWNIDIREPRDGVSGKCLPKDMALLHAISENEFLQFMMQRNQKYADSKKT